jgi:glycosyltransferase involved in cell wall biosynthesis
VNKFFDYLAAGKPLVLAGNPSSNPVEATHCGLTVPPRDPGALAEAIIKLYRMPPEERAEMGERGREYVEEHHDIRKLAERLEQVLGEAARGP